MKDYYLLWSVGVIKIRIVRCFPHKNHFVIDRDASRRNPVLHQANDEDQGQVA